MSEESMTIIVFSGEFDKALAAFNLANTGASMGMDVTMFFTFWGLGVVKKGSLSRGNKGFMQWMMNIMKRGGADHLKLSQMNMLGAGTGTIKSLMKKYKMPSLPESMALAKEQGVRFVACTTSMALMGLEEDDFVGDVDEFVGAATYLSLASEGKVNLFI
ncbi:MAG: DsrE/DsrF/DrsH-like family protein [Actinobacteria bacterium]|nr:DsrE/DsrF/DrsH-like family protein [Actinomycetota bacterium]